MCIKLNSLVWVPPVWHTNFVLFFQVFFNLGTLSQFQPLPQIPEFRSFWIECRHLSPLKAIFNVEMAYRVWQ